MRLDANLPWELWPEVVRSAVYLYNRTPRYLNCWRSPYEEFFTRVAYQLRVVASPRKPNQSHLRTYGCKAFAMTDNTKRHKGRLQRLDPKAWIGYLVRYQLSNIFRVWVPLIGKVISTRDVVLISIQSLIEVRSKLWIILCTALLKRFSGGSVRQSYPLLLKSRTVRQTRSMRTRQ